MKKKQEEHYMLTLGGLLGDEEAMQKIKAYLFTTKCNAIIFEECNEGTFAKVETKK